MAIMVVSHTNEDGEQAVNFLDKCSFGQTSALHFTCNQ